MGTIYESLFRRVLFPAYESGLRQRKTLAYLREYERNQWLDPEQLQALQWRRLKALLAHCYREVPYYREQWRGLGVTPDDIRDLADYARLPVLTKRDIRENFDRLIAAPYRDRMLYKATGGSTGEPLRLGYTRESYERRVAVMWRGYGWAGATLGRRALFLWGGAVGDPSRKALLKDRLYHAALHRRVLNSFRMRDDNLAEFAEAVAAYRPEVIVSYVGPIVRLAQWMSRNGRRVAGVQSVLGAAEALHDFQRPIIEDAFPGARAYNTYGCREVMLIASECEHREGLHVNADHLVVELHRPSAGADGETGELAITDLSNYGMPFIRYLNGDVATRAHAGEDRPCACGRGLPRLKRVEGRKLDAIRTPAGHVLPGEFFPHMLKDVPGLRRFQIVQQRLDSFRLSIVPGPEFGPEQEAYVRREIAKVLGESAQVDLRLVDDIPLTATGKFRVTVSELP